VQNQPITAALKRCATQGPGQSEFFLQRPRRSGRDEATGAGVSLARRSIEETNATQGDLLPRFDRDGTSQIAGVDLYCCHPSNPSCLYEADARAIEADQRTGPGTRVQNNISVFFCRHNNLIFNNSDF
jgi:hypothetical protein